MLLDTHALIWLSEGSNLLDGKVLTLIGGVLKSELFVSQSVFGSLLCWSKECLSIDISVPVWCLNLMSAGLQELPLRGCIVTRSAQLFDFYGDPADRMVVATAIHPGATLCTAGQKTCLGA